MGNPHVDLVLREVWIEVEGIKCLWPFDEKGRLGKVRKSRAGWGRDESSRWVSSVGFAEAVRVSASAVADHLARAHVRKIVTVAVPAVQQELFPR